MGTAADWSRDSDGGFSNRTFDRSWQNSEEQLRQGRFFRVRYIGKMQILASMRTMPFDDRACVAKECISRVCEEAGMTTPSKKRKTERKIQQVLGHIDLENGGEDINLIVNVERIQIISLSGENISSHELPEISFASGGDAETIDFIAYVGKTVTSPVTSRWCYVIECGAGVTQECVATIGQAFDLKFKQFLQRGVPASSSNASNVSNTNSNASSNTNFNSNTNSNANSNTNSNSNVNSNVKSSGSNAIGGVLSESREAPTHSKLPSAGKQLSPPGHTKRRLPAKVPVDSNYYNDMPGKSAPQSEEACVPDTTAPPAPLPAPRGSRGELKTLQLSTVKPSDSNLIDLNSPAHDKVKKGGDFQDFNVMDPLLESQHENSDPFNVAGVKHLLESNLESFVWFHGRLSRQDAEGALKRDGDFLVRVSTTVSKEAPPIQQQYVLSGQHMGMKTHILLVDFDGVVRTRNHDFQSIPDLIDVHFSSQEALMSSDKEIFLRHPVPRGSAL